MNTYSENARSYLNQSELFQTLSAISRGVSIFPESTLNLKAKAQTRAYSICDTLWKYHNAIHAPLHDMKGTIVLQGTLNSIPYLVEECATFTSHYEILMEKVALANSVPELRAYYQTILSYKPRDILTLLINEVKKQNEKYDLGIDIKDIVNHYNSHKSKG